MRILKDAREFIEIIALAIYVELYFLFKIGGKHGKS